MCFQDQAMRRKWEEGFRRLCDQRTEERDSRIPSGDFYEPVFRVYTTPDTLGVELGGSLKNVIALAAGTADGLGYGDNTKAALITRGIAELHVWEQKWAHIWRRSMDCPGWGI